MNMTAHQIFEEISRLDLILVIREKSAVLTRRGGAPVRVISKAIAHEIIKSGKMMPYKGESDRWIAK